MDLLIEVPLMTLVNLTSALLTCENLDIDD